MLPGLMARSAWSTLWREASKARRFAYAPYSGFLVGAALEGVDGVIVSGCNVENASYGLTVCAERNAIAALVLTGQTLKRVAIVVDSHAPTPPCGACRQVLAEFGGPTLEVRSRTLSGAEARYRLGELLPHAFTRGFLGASQDLKKKTRSTG